MRRLTPFLRAMALALAAAAGVAPLPASAAPAQIQITPQTDLRFGSFAVMDSGYRIVGPTGNVQNSGVFSIVSGDTGPARFTVSYDRGNNSRKQLNLRIQMVIAPAPVVTQGGIVARLSNYQTDLPGYGVVNAGQIIEITIPNCVDRLCQKTFFVGGRLDIDRTFGGANISVPIPVDVVLISVK